MQRSFVLVFIVLSSLLTSATPADDQSLAGYSAEGARVERDWEAKFRAIPSADNQRDYMKRLSARPHHVGSAYDKDNAEWLLAKMKEWGLDAHIENFDVPLGLLWQNQDFEAVSEAIEARYSTRLDTSGVLNTEIGPPSFEAKTAVLLVTESPPSL
jgi:hypothetical protein